MDKWRTVTVSLVAIGAEVALSAIVGVWEMDAVTAGTIAASIASIPFAVAGKSAVQHGALALLKAKQEAAPRVQVQPGRPRRDAEG